MPLTARRLVVAVALASSILAAGCAGTAPPIEYATASPAVRSALATDARRAVSADRTVADAAVAALRAAGPAGLDALFDVWPGAIARLGGAPAPGPFADPGGGAPDPERLRAAIERVSRQRDAHAAHLYWYTDMDEAVRAARATHRPILSLRLLGNLDEELSCANSRFFRTTLYPNPAIGELLRRGFVLHWQSERPAPRITIDFGDGRRMERTLTGNSVHYVLDEEGRPVDALPGLYGPAAFLRGLTAAREVAVAAAHLEGEARRAFVRDYHARAGAALDDAWRAEHAALGVPAAALPAMITGTGPSPSAAQAAPVAMAKSGPEAPVVGALGVGPVPILGTPVSPEVWATLLRRHAGDARLDARSRALMRRKIATELDPTGTRLVPLDDRTFARRVESFERLLTEDTVRNELSLHRTLHAWLSAPSSPDGLAELNRAVYASLFLTPRVDPWLGLLVEDGYTAIDGEGLVLGPVLGPQARGALRPVARVTPFPRRARARRR